MTAKKEEQLDMIEDQATGDLSEDQNDFLKTLEAEEDQADFDPEQAKAEEAEAEKQAVLDEQTAGMTAAMGLGTIEFALRRVIHPEFEFTASTKEYAIENLAPILIKYGALLPSWLNAYDAEIKAAMAVGKLVSEGVDTAKTLKAQDAEKEASQATNEPQEKERVRVAA
jgi:hypothetical protein